MANNSVIEKRLSSCCISHEFYKVASKNPNKIAVIHARGGAKFAKECRQIYEDGKNLTTVSYIDSSTYSNDKFFDEFIATKSLSAHPPVYEGDVCFTFAQILAAVDSLSYRLRRILDGGNDPCLIRPTSGNYSGGLSVRDHISESSNSSSPGVEQSTEFQNMYTPRILGIHMIPSVEYIISVLTILRCGEAFMPLDPSWPKERILSIVSSSKADLIIECLSSIDGNCSHQLDKSHWLVDCSSSPVLFLSMKENLQEFFGSSHLVWPCENEKLRLFCYLMYTSGSTGNPKGVCGTEPGLLNRFLWMQEFYPLHGEELLLFKTSVSFIDHLQEFLGALLTTCTLVIPPFDELKENIFSIADYIQAYSINRLVSVPSLMRAILPALQSPCIMSIQSSLKILILSGEVLHLSLWDELSKLLPKTAILNLYGSTERDLSLTTMSLHAQAYTRCIYIRHGLRSSLLLGQPYSLIEELFQVIGNSFWGIFIKVSGDCTYFDCKRLPLILESEALSSVPIGLPIPNCDVVLLAGEDALDQGEIYVGGLCVATGYISYPSIMPLEYVKLPQNSCFSCSTSEQASQYYFKTGDFARQLQSGDLVFLGRKDRTIKVNGQRIALEEIESTLREHQDVIDAAVISCEGKGEATILEAYLVTKQKDECGESLRSSIRSWMVEKIPLAMIPNSFFFTKSFPMSSTGKVDYKLLAGSIRSMAHARNEIEDIPNSDLLQVIKKAFCDALMVEKVSNDDDFFAIGGDSISAAHASHNLGINMRLLYTFPSPLKLQMALLEIKGSSKHDVRIGGHPGVDMKVPEGSKLLSIDSRTSNLCKSKPRGRLSLTLCNTSVDYHPVKYLKMGLYMKPQGVSPRDGYPWNSSSIRISCSFSRCNKVMHGGEYERDSLCQATWSQEIPSDEKGSMRELWKVHMESCVDASPLVVFRENDIYLFIGSHSHKFLCINAKSGSVQWEIKLEGRVECSAAILGDFSQVVVGCYQGNIYFLDSLNGSICWTFRTCGEVKSQPVVDDCRHLVWCGSYDHNLYALDYRSYRCIYKLPCGGSIYGSPAIDEVHDKLCVASTTGYVTAISIKALPFAKLWLQDLGAPIFGSLSINSCNGNVICCLVDGHVVALDTSGSIIWRGKTSGPIFAGPCISHILPSQVLICSRNGSIYSFELEKGDLLWEHNVGDPITSAAYVDENLHLVSDPSRLSDRLVCVCASSGSIHLLRINLETVNETNRPRKDMVQEFARFDLQGDIFSSPVMIGGRVFVGCRDDYVHCIGVDEPYFGGNIKTI